MNNKKYQVFISSTYTDLKDERRKVLDILLMADCIPAGMEAFSATDDEQFEVIKRVIDLCDYYILIIGKRYGTVHPSTEKSYTEMEYDYAKEKGIPVLVFAIDDDVELPTHKSETELEMMLKLKNFKSTAMKNRLASMWKNSEDLTGKIAIAIMRAITEIHRPGWQRAVDFDEASLRRELMESQAANKELQAKVEDLKKKLQEAQTELSNETSQNDSAFNEYKFEFEYYYVGTSDKTLCKTITLPEIFSFIAVAMLGASFADEIEELFVQQAIGINYYLCNKQIINRILLQLQALKLIESQWSDSKSEFCWRLTYKGVKVRDEMVVVKNNHHD